LRPSRDGGETHTHWPWGLAGVAGAAE